LIVVVKFFDLFSTPWTRLDEPGFLSLGNLVLGVSTLTEPGMSDITA